MAPLSGRLSDASSEVHEHARHLGICKANVIVYLLGRGYRCVARQLRPPPSGDIRLSDSEASSCALEIGKRNTETLIIATLPRDFTKSALLTTTAVTTYEYWLSDNKVIYVVRRRALCEKTQATVGSSWFQTGNTTFILETTLNWHAIICNELVIRSCCQTIPTIK